MLKKLLLSCLFIERSLESEEGGSDQQIRVLYCRVYTSLVPRLLPRESLGTRLGLHHLQHDNTVGNNIMTRPFLAKCTYLLIMYLFCVMLCIILICVHVLNTWSYRLNIEFSHLAIMFHLANHLWTLCICMSYAHPSKIFFATVFNPAAALHCSLCVVSSSLLY